MSDEVTPQEWRVRREIRSLAWFAIGVALVFYARGLDDITDPVWWFVRDFSYGFLTMACVIRGWVLRPDLPRSCPQPEREREWS